MCPPLWEAAGPPLPRTLEGEEGGRREEGHMEVCGNGDKIMCGGVRANSPIHVHSRARKLTLPHSFYLRGTGGPGNEATRKYSSSTRSCSKS